MSRNGCSRTYCSQHSACKSCSNADNCRQQKENHELVKKDLEMVQRALQNRNNSLKCNGLCSYCSEEEFLECLTLFKDLLCNQ